MTSAIKISQQDNQIFIDRRIKPKDAIDKITNVIETANKILVEEEKNGACFI